MTSNGSSKERQREREKLREGEREREISGFSSGLSQAVGWSEWERQRMGDGEKEREAGLGVHGRPVAPQHKHPDSSLTQAPDG